MSSWKDFDTDERRQLLKAWFDSALSAGGVEKADSDSLEKLLEILESDFFTAGREQLEIAGFDQVVQDFLDAYPQLVQAEPELTQRVLHRFCDLLFQRDEELKVTNVFTWLQPRVGTSFLSDVVEYVASGLWRRSLNSDPKKAKRFELLCRRSRGSLWRRKRLHDEARQELSILTTEWSKFDPAETREVSVILYELGYIDFLEGNTKESVDAFFQGATLAEQSGDVIGSLINRFCAYHTLYFGREISVDDAKQHFESLLNDLINRTPEYPDDTRTVSWRRTMYQRLFEVACERGDLSSAEAYASDAERHELTQRGNEDPTYRFMRSANNGRLEILRGNPDDALNSWATFLDAELPGLEYLSRPDEKLVHQKRFEQAVYYLEAGNIYLSKGQTETAASLFACGLRLPANVGNRFCQADIRKLMEKHGLPAS